MEVKIGEHLRDEQLINIVWQVQAQTSRYHGVRLNKRTRKWEAYIRVAGKHVHLGCYDGEVAAAQVQTLLLHGIALAAALSHCTLHCTA